MVQFDKHTESWQALLMHAGFSVIRVENVELEKRKKFHTAFLPTGPDVSLASFKFKCVGYNPTNLPLHTPREFLGASSLCISI